MSARLIDDICRCPLCTADSISTGKHRDPAGAAPAAAPAAAIGERRVPPVQRPDTPYTIVTVSNPDKGPPPAWRGPLRGPVQDESGKLDPIDALAMRAAEGRTVVDDMIDGGAL